VNALTSSILSFEVSLVFVMYYLLVASTDHPAGSQRLRRGRYVGGFTDRVVFRRFCDGRHKFGHHTRDWLKMKNPDAPAVKREAEEEWRRR
jgi:hypothetical protein